MGLMLGSIGVPSATGSGSATQLGRFSDWITTFVIVVSITFAMLSHVGAFGWHGDALIDLFATIAIGAVLGRAGGLSAGSAAATAALADVNENTRRLVARADLNTALADAAHKRLDTINAPAAPIDHTGFSAGNPKGPRDG